jgi:hypothetical protein
MPLSVSGRRRGVDGHGGDVEHPVVCDRADELVGIAERRRAGREEDAHRVGLAREVIHRKSRSESVTSCV